MKSIIIAFVVSFLMLADLSGQWEIVRDTIYPVGGGKVKPGLRSKDICFINHNNGFIVDFWFCHSRSEGIILMTVDGGVTWNTVFSLPNVNLANCIFTTDTKGFVSGHGFYQTSDGGVNWLSGNGLTRIKDLLFVNEQLGFAAADSSIYKTVNGSESWEKIYNGPSCELNSIFFIDESTGWVVGESGLIMMYTNQGTWKTIPSGTTLPLNKIVFADSCKGWISGGYWGGETILLKTVNGGESWSKIENLDCWIHDFYFINDQEGWAVGENSTGGIIITTIDGGNSWSVQVDSLRVPLKAIDFKDGFGWALGNGLVLKLDIQSLTYFWPIPATCVDTKPFNLTQGSPSGGNYSGPGIEVSPQFDPAIAGVGIHTITYTYTNDKGCTNSATQTITVFDSTSTGIKEYYENYNRNSILFQNSPNPFVSETVISYYLTTTDEVDLCVYDITGRMVTTLVKEQQSAGRYDIGWNTVGMTPGIYFCELKADLKRKIIKMIMIK